MSRFKVRRYYLRTEQCIFSYNDRHIYLQSIAVQFYIIIPSDPLVLALAPERVPAVYHSYGVIKTTACQGC